MSKLVRTILPKVRNSLRTKGVLRTAGNCLIGPYHLLRQYQRMKDKYGPSAPDAFDLEYGVETTDRVHLSDLTVKGQNWIFADGYWPTPTRVFRDALSELPIPHEQFVFIDFGCGKGRVLLLASDFPFKRIVGIDFALELHRIAEKNLRRYQSATQRCKQISVLHMDFAEYQLPAEPVVIYLYNPSSLAVTRIVAANLARSLAAHPRPVWVVYVTPAYDVFGPGTPLQLTKVTSNRHYAIFTNEPILAGTRQAAVQ